VRVVGGGVVDREEEEEGMAFLRICFMVWRLKLEGFWMVMGYEYGWGDRAWVDGEEGISERQISMGVWIWRVVVILILELG